jgi:hypothetical protein
LNESFTHVPDRYTHLSLSAKTKIPRAWSRDAPAAPVHEIDSKSIRMDYITTASAETSEFFINGLYEK